MALVDVVWLGLLSEFMAFFLPLFFSAGKGGLLRPELDELST